MIFGLYTQREIEKHIEEKNKYIRICFEHDKEILDLKRENKLLLRTIKELNEIPPKTKIVYRKR